MSKRKASCTTSVAGTPERKKPRGRPRKKGKKILILFPNPKRCNNKSFLCLFHTKSQYFFLMFTNLTFCSTKLVNLDEDQENKFLTHLKVNIPFNGFFYPSRSMSLEVLVWFNSRQNILFR